MHSSVPPSLCLAVRAGTDGTRGTRTHQESPSMPKAQPPAAPPGPVSCLLPRGPCEVLNGLTINFHGLLCGEWLLPVPGSALPEPKGGIMAEVTGSATALVATEHRHYPMALPLMPALWEMGIPAGAASTGGGCSPQKHHPGTGQRGRGSA